MAPWTRTLRVEAPRQRVEGTVNRVSALAGGSDVWFESADASLTPAPEAFGSLLLIPALHLGRRLSLAAAVCPEWTRNLKLLPRLVAGWWNYPAHEPALNPTATPGTPLAGTALCFTGGVDSFYSLLRGPHPIDVLVFAAGYDAPLANWARCARAASLVQSVAAEFGLRAVVVASNARISDPFRRTPWARSHGGALAALGHLLSGEVGRLVASSSFVRASNQPWGSRWDVDPCFGSSRLRVEHVGDDLWRYQKLGLIAGEEVVRRHLRVCWQDTSDDDVNCGTCEKCVRTMLGLEVCGHLEHFRTFPRRHDLPAAVNRLDPVDASIVRVYERFLDEGLRLPLKKAVRDLLARTAAFRPPWRKRIRAWWRRVRGV